MRWEDRGRSRNLEGRRGSRGPGRGVALGGLGLGGMVLVLVLSLVTGVDLFSVLGPATAPTNTAPTAQQEAPLEDPAEEEMVRFTSFVLDHSQATWRQIFIDNGIQYRDAQLVLFRDSVASECGNAPSAVGPFYCPLDQSVYIDLSFFGELRTRYGAPGDFAHAYVLAHEIGHHVQNLLGTVEEVHSARQANPSAAVGDDRLRGGRGGSVDPESFTHGSSEQRMQWFRNGYDSGDPTACNTFASL